MTRNDPSPALAAIIPAGHELTITLRVDAATSAGAHDGDTIRVVVSGATPARPPPEARPGHDIHTVGAWPEHGVLGSQLGPNKNGRTW